MNDRGDWDDTPSDHEKPEDPFPFSKYIRSEYNTGDLEDSENYQAALDMVSAILAANSLQAKRRRRRKLLFSIIGAISAIVLIFTSISYIASVKSAVGGNASQPAFGNFNYDTCPFTPGKGIIVGMGVRCGYLTVPEDHKQPKGPTIKLAVAIFKTLHPQPDSQPVLYLAGGPGGALLSDLGTYINFKNLENITIGRDLILLDQRGTGYSHPQLSCRELSGVQQLAGENMYLQAFQACHDRLVHSGINLNTYTTIDNASDVHDLIHALGYKQVNLYGVSYGTRLALTVMRLYPTDVRSAVLDSVVPVQDNLFNTLPSVIQHAFDVFFRGCVQDSHCNAAYPQLQELFYKLVNDLNTRPIRFADTNDDTVIFDGSELVNWLFEALYVTSLIPSLPKVIAQIDKGDYRLLSLSYSVLNSRYDRSSASGGDFSDGLYYSVECGEDMAFTNAHTLQDATDVLNPAIKSQIRAELMGDVATCRIWHQKTAPSEQKSPVRSSIPTLLLSGEYDPITPTTNAQKVMQTLSHSYLFVFPGTGHGVFNTSICPDSIMSAFLSRPLEKPSGNCIATMHEPKFV